MPDLTSDDGLTLYDVPDKYTLDSPEVQARFDQMRTNSMRSSEDIPPSNTATKGPQMPSGAAIARHQSSAPLPNNSFQQAQQQHPNDPGYQWYIAHGGKPEDYGKLDDVAKGIIKGAAPSIVGGALGALTGPEGIIPGIGAANMIMGGADLTQAGLNATGIKPVQAPLPSQQTNKALDQFMGPTQTPEGRIAQAASEGASGAIGMGATGKVLENAGVKLSGMLPGAVNAEGSIPGVLQRTGQILQAGEAQNIAGSAAAGGASQNATENGATPLQAALTGLGTGLAASVAMSTPQMMKNLMSRTPTQQEQLIQDAKDLGNATLLTRDVFQPQGGFAKLFDNFSKNNPFGPIQGKINGPQASDRVDAAKSVLQSFAMPTADDALAQSFADFRSQQLSKYTSQKANVLNALDQTGKPVPMTNTVAAIDSAIEKLQSMNNPSLNPAINSLQNLRKGVMGGTQDIDSLMTNYKPGSGIPAGAFGTPPPDQFSQTINNIEANRQIFGGALNDSDFAVKTQLQKMAGPVYAAINKDMGTFIKQNGKPGDVEKWANANANLSSMMDDFKNSNLSSMLNKGEGDVNTAQKLLFSANPSENKMLFDGLTPQGKEAAKSVITSKVLADATDPKTGNLDPTQVHVGMTKYAQQMGIYLSESDKDRIRGLQNYLQATIPPAGVDHNSSFLYSHILPTLVTGGIGAMTGMHEGGMTGAVVGGIAGAASLGTIAGIYNSPTVRNSLTVLSKASANSFEGQNAIRKLNAVFAQHGLRNQFSNSMTQSGVSVPETASQEAQQ